MEEEVEDPGVTTELYVVEVVGAEGVVSVTTLKHAHISTLNVIGLFLSFLVTVIVTLMASG